MSLLRRALPARGVNTAVLSRPARALSALTGLLLFLGGCGTEPEIPALVTLDTGSISFTALGEQQQLTSSVTDQDGNPLTGVSVNWSTTNAAVATVTETGLVTARGIGAAEIRAAAGSGNASAQVTVVQTPNQIQKVSGDGQSVPAGAALPAPLVLQVNDSRGNGIPGAAVTFTVSQGEGSVSTISATTGTDGRASTGFSTGLDSGSPQEVLAQVQSTTVSESFSAIVPADPTSFNIGIRYLATPTATQRQAFTNARLRWEAAITQDIEDGLLEAEEGSCGTDSPAVEQVVDDVLILVNLVPIDGVGGVIGGAGPCWIRDPGDLTVMGAMQFDTEDLESIEQDGILSNVILHEMGHVLGLGTLWELQGFLADPSLPDTSDADPHFTGAQAINAFDQVGGAAYVGGKVPVDNSTGPDGAPLPGTADSHWRESVLGNELMTGFIGAGSSPLSIVTLASLADQGYGIDLSSADPYSLMLSLRAFDTQPALRLKNDILRIPIKKVDARGRVTGVIRQ